MMRRVSKKTAARVAECRDVRDQLRQSIGQCELCGHSPNRASTGSLSWRLDLHEISRGVNRQKSLDKPYALLLVCYPCHMLRIHGNEDWPEARQLAALKRSRPQDHDLAAYNLLIGRGPKRITEDEVAVWANDTE
jgi:hypothetical protein